MTTEERREKVLQMYRDKRRVADIVAELKISTSTLYSILEAAGARSRYTNGPDRKRSRQVRPKTKELHDRIRKMIADGKTHAEVAIIENKAIGSIYRICPAVAGPSPEDVENCRKVVEHYHKTPNATAKVVASALSLPVSLVRRALAAAGIKGLKPREIDPEILKQAKELYHHKENPLSLTAIARQLHVSENRLMKQLNTRSKREAAKAAWARRKDKSNANPPVQIDQAA